MPCLLYSFHIFLRVGSPGYNTFFCKHYPLSWRVVCNIQILHYAVVPALSGDSVRHDINNKCSEFLRAIPGNYLSKDFLSIADFCANPQYKVTAMKLHGSNFLFDNNELLRNSFSVPVVRRAHIRNNANEFLHPVHARLLFYKINRTHRHNQADKEHPGKRYEGVAG